MQKEPAKAGSFFYGRGEMMGSGFKAVVADSLVSSALRGRCPVEADRRIKKTML